MTQDTGKTGLRRVGRTFALVLAIILVGGSGRPEAQTLAVPQNMPILYKEIPVYASARPRARYPVKLPRCAIEYRKDGYYLISGNREFVILNQNPACLKRFAGKMVAVQGKTTERPAPWCRLYFVVIDTIDGRKYEGKVGPWMVREPTDEEICYWNLHKQLPPATQKFLDYLALPRPTLECRPAAYEAGCDQLAYSAAISGPESPLPAADVNRQLTAIQRQLTVIEQKVDKKPYRGVNSIPSSQWNSTDWSLYMDSQGGG